MPGHPLTATSPSPADDSRLLPRKLAGGLGVLCALMALAALGWGAAVGWAGAAGVGQALRQIGLPAVAAGLVLVTCTLALRAWRWQLILGRWGHRLPTTLNLRVYLAGLALSATPGKVGELSRALLLVPHGVPTARSVAAFLCDRMADVLGVAALGALAGWLAARPEPVLQVLAAAGLAASLVAALAWPRLGRPLSRPQALASAARRGGAWAHDAASAWAQAWRGPAPWAFIAIAMLAYGAQAWLFASFVQQLQPQVSTLAAVAIFMSSVLIGAASMVPGGVGTTDLALVWQLQNLGVPLQAALAATLAVRTCTLGWAWLLGTVALFSFVRPARGAA